MKNTTVDLLLRFQQSVTEAGTWQRSGRKMEEAQRQSNLEKYEEKKKRRLLFIDGIPVTFVFFVVQAPIFYVNKLCFCKQVVF